MAYTKLNVVNPVLQKGVHYLTSDYKSRNTKRPTHKGMDFIGKLYGSDYIIAIADGEVVTSGYSSSCGYNVKIKHSNGVSSVYYHMKKGTLKVAKGDTVKKGTVLGYMGNTGNSRGTHLHFGIMDKKSNALDPKPYLITEGIFDTKDVKKNYSGTYPKIPLRGYFKSGDKGTQVKNLQLLLNWANGCRLSTDGILGAKSIEQVKVFQKNNALTVDGKFGKNCLNKAKGIKK